MSADVIILPNHEIITLLGIIEGLRLDGKFSEESMRAWEHESIWPCESCKIVAYNRCRESCDVRRTRGEEDKCGGQNLSGINTTHYALFRACSTCKDLLSVHQSPYLLLLLFAVQVCYLRPSLTTHHSLINPSISSHLIPSHLDPIKRLIIINPPSAKQIWSS